MYVYISLLKQLMADEFFVGIGDINATHLGPNKPFIPEPNKLSPVPKPSEQVETVNEEVGPYPLKQGQECANGSSGTVEQTKKSSEKTKAESYDHGEQGSMKSPASKLLPKHTPSESKASDMAKRPSATTDTCISLDAKQIPPNQDNVVKCTSTEAVLHDDDAELELTWSLLDMVHTNWYAQYDANSKDEAPDVQHVLGAIKKKVLQGCTLTFSGLIPMQQVPETYVSTV